MPRVPGYKPLSDVLDEAYQQSAMGKGKERHANDAPFMSQPIMRISRSVGPGFPLGQATKKVLEAAGMIERGNRKAGRFELLGAIIYLAAACILLDEKEEK